MCRNRPALSGNRKGEIMSKITNTLFVASLSLLASIPALAAEEIMPDKPGVPSLGAIMGASGINVSGYIDVSYTSLSSGGTFVSGTPSRVYDRERNSFNVNMVDVTVSSLPADGVGGLVNLNFGPDANVNAPAGTGPLDEFDIQAAYVHYASGPFMAIAGKYVTLAGAEVIKAPANLNYSRSILFGYAIPFTHTGARVTYTVNDKLALIAGINNGWDVLKESASSDKKTLELGFSASAIGPFALSGVIYAGKEPGAAVGKRTLFDLVATYNATDALSFVLNYDYATQEDAVTVGQKAKWSGVAGYVNYKFTDTWRAALRAESLDDKDGYRTGVVQKWDEMTVTLAYAPSANVELRGEVRSDKSDKQSFLQTDGTAKDTQTSVGLQAIYKF